MFYIWVHILQQVMEIIQMGADSKAKESDSEHDKVEEGIMVVQAVPNSGQKISSALQPKKRKTMIFIFMLGKQELLILLDSVSSGTSINEATTQHC
jgi:hypothetical protein